MKKIFKISTVALIAFALVSNLYTSLFSFYGIKTNNLQGAVWANALSTTGSSSGGGSSTDVTTTSSWFNQPKYNKIWCGEIIFTTGYTGTLTAGASGSMTQPGGQVVATVSGGFFNSTSAIGSIAAHWAEEMRCTGPLAFTFCLSETGIDACM